MARHAQKAALHSKESVSIGFDSDIGAALRKYAADIREQALRPAAYAAAAVLYREMKTRTASFAKTGTLRDSIYHWHDSKQSTKGRQVYAIGPNKVKAPHFHMVEYGTSKMAAHPYIRPTWDSKIGEAMAAAKKRLAEKMKEIGGKS